jgi:glycosyltransferase involved in cell wall biosynthesis
VIPVTQVLARIVEASGVERDRIRVMGNGIDQQLVTRGVGSRSARERLGWGDRVVLGFTGFVREWNGLEKVVDLLGAPGNEALALLVVGDGPARREMEERSAERGIGHRVRFTGRLQRSEIAYWVAAFDVALQPAANSYASPLKLFEYMALGRAIVAPNQPNIREVLQHERTALLFDPDEEGDFGRAVQRLAFDPEMRDRLGRTAALTIRQRDMTWSQNASRVAELAEQLVQADQIGVAAPGRSFSVR